MVIQTALTQTILFKVAIIKLQSILSNKAENVPFNVIQYIIGEVIYGGIYLRFHSKNIKIDLSI